MAHQVAEFLAPVADLVVCDRRHRPMYSHTVRGEGAVPLAVEDQALLAVDVGGRIEDFVAIVGIDTDETCCAFLLLSG